MRTTDCRLSGRWVEDALIPAGVKSCEFLNDGVNAVLIPVGVESCVSLYNSVNYFVLPNTNGMGVLAHACGARARTHANPAGSRLEISGRNPKDEGLRVVSCFQVERNALPGHAERSGAVILSLIL